MPVIRHARTQAPSPSGRPPTGRRTAISGVTAMLLLGGSVVAGAGSASAVETAESNAEARFLSGSLLQGVDLDQVANLAGVAVSNVGLDDSVIETGSVSLTALERVRIPLEGGITLPLGDLMELGAPNQFGEAAPEGVSRSASGAVSDTGVVNTTGGGRFPSDASISLTPFLAGAGVDAVVSDLQVQLRAISAVAGLDAAKERRIASSCVNLDAPMHCRDYYIAGGDLSLTAPGLATLGAALTGTGGVAASVDQAVNGLAGNNGPVAKALAAVNSTLAPLLGDSGLTVRISSNVENSLDRIVNQPLTDGVVSIDLTTGRISVDLEKLLGVQLHNLPPNTELLTPALINDLAARVAGLLQKLPGQVQAALTSALNAATLSIEGSVCAVGTGDDCSLAGVLDPITDLPVTMPDLGGVIGGGGVIDPDDLDPILDPVLNVLPALPALPGNPLSLLSAVEPDRRVGAAAVTGLRVSVDAGGTLAEVLGGTATAVVTLESPAGEATLDIEDALLDAVAVPITTGLFADDAALDAAVATVTGAITRALAALAPALGPLAELASLRVNVQEAGSVPGSFREVALRLTLGEAVGSGGLATLDIARAQVGPNALPTPVEQPGEEPPAEQPPAEQPPAEQPPAEEPPITAPDEGKDITVLPAAGAPDVMPLAYLGGLLMVAGAGLLLAGRRTAPVAHPKP